MEQFFSAQRATHSLPSTDGCGPGSWRSERVFSASKICEACGELFKPWIKRDQSGAVKSVMKPSQWAKQRFCSISCSKRKENAMSDPVTRRKMAHTLKQIGHKPKTRGGNGTGLTWHQAVMLEILGKDWIAEHPVPTKISKRNGYPTCYKIDIANPRLMIGIELDGNSHKGKRAAEDAKKDALLTSFGWQIFRVKNIRAQSLFLTCKSADTLLTLLMAS